MTEFDRKYISLLNNAIQNGYEKVSFSTSVKSLFAKQVTFNLKKGIPFNAIGETKTREIIHELLWYLKNDTTINYLAINNVHTWDDDAYLFFKDWVSKNELELKEHGFDIIDGFCTCDSPIWAENELHKNNVEWLKSITKEDVIEYAKMPLSIVIEDNVRFVMGEMGITYGNNWRNFNNIFDQVQNVVDTLKNSPDGNISPIISYNPLASRFNERHSSNILLQFYVRELTKKEQMEEFNKLYVDGRINVLYFDAIKSRPEYYENADVELKEEDYGLAGIPQYALSCMQVCGEQNLLETPFSWAWASILIYMIAFVTNMVPDEYVWVSNNSYINLSQTDNINEIINKNTDNESVYLKFTRNVYDINDFKIEDFLFTN